MDSATIEHSPVPPHVSSNETDPEDVDNNIGLIPNPVTPDVLVRPDRRQVVYNAEERKVLDAHKERYLASKSVEEHKSVAKTYILPDIFQYWDDIGHEIGDSRTQTRKLVAWMQNTWRGTKVAETVIAGAAMKRTEVLWQTRKDDVFAEIARLMGLDSVSTQTPNWFAFRMKALGIILQHMSALDLEKLDRQGEAIVSAANQDNERKQQLAEKHAISRFSKGTKCHWNEMRVLSLSFVAYTDSSNKLVVQVHDQMAELMEVDAPLFESQYRPQVHQMKLYVMEYITQMKKILNPGPQPWAPGGTGKNVRDLNLQFDHYGFPILPPALNTKSGDLPVKKELEDMVRKYLAKHYKLATGGKTKHVPYKQLQENQARFIFPEYLPSGFEMKDPRDLTLSELLSLIDHILGRQETHPTSHIFRFSVVNAKRKGYNPVRTHYPDDSGNEHFKPEKPSDPVPIPVPVPVPTWTVSKQPKKQSNATKA
ncbi:hypothetical protein CVT25_015013 [Psilocybe cyanescens]|uniref:Uncharacterized protein n=1 Tax=Psilocybe cyanescens TaxID=93625 RepID=A0A409XAL7_PSICY|nr:hypothetical protein CVT25_015013 [Psilocybe cyanescens]